jgi:hypothetical protein
MDWSSMRPNRAEPSAAPVWEFPSCLELCAGSVASARANRAQSSDAAAMSALRRRVADRRMGATR